MEAVLTPTDYETERGKPVPSLNHGVVQAFLIASLLRYREKYTIVSELSLTLDGKPYVPDISIYPKLAVDWQHDHVKKTEPPLTVVEILSPTQSLDSLITKADAYFAAGVQSCWIVQTVLESVVVLVPGKKPSVHTGGEFMDPVTDITVKLAEIFPPME